MPRPVLSKLDFARRYMEGEFGNRSPSWDTLEEFERDGYRDGPVHIRNRIKGGPTWYNIAPLDVVPLARRLMGEGHRQLYYSAMAPTALTTFQGEVERTADYLSVFYSRVTQPMRAALLQGGEGAGGLKALLLMRRFMDPSSFDWVQELLDKYPDHVIEFSCYSRNWGTVPRRNTIIWEVRKY